MKTENKEDLIDPEKTIRKSLAVVLIPIFIILIIVLSIRNNSLSYLEKEYKAVRNSSYSGKITDLLLNEDNGANRPILIDNKWKKEIPYYIHQKLTVGDSLYKKAKSDFEYYVRPSKTDVIKRDVNKFYREKYFTKVNEK